MSESDQRARGCARHGSLVFASILFPVDGAAYDTQMLSTAMVDVPVSTWLGCGAVAGYLLMMWTNPVSSSLRDGGRALRRYPSLWIVFGALGFGQALVELAVRAHLHAVLPAEERPALMWFREAWRDPQLWLAGSAESVWWLPHGELVAAVRESILSAVESLAGLFNCVVGSFPLSAIAAVLLVVNWRGSQGTLWRALRKRFGGAGWAVHLVLLICALAAMAKPLLYTSTRLVPFDWWLPWAAVAAWLSFIFEYLFGVCVQIYLLLVAFAWVRGLTFERIDLLHVAIRRFSFVMKWSLIILLLSSILIDAPLILKNFKPFAAYFPEDELFATRLPLARAALALFVLLGASVQITLTLHSESWRKALRDHLRFVAGNAWPFGWFLIIAGFHFWMIHALVTAVARGVGEGTSLWVVWQLLSPWLFGLVAGWLLASWVCVFKRAEPARADAAEPIRF